MMNLFYFDQIGASLARLEKEIEHIPHAQAKRMLKEIEMIKLIVTGTYSVCQHFEDIWEKAILDTSGPNVLEKFQNSSTEEPLTYLDKFYLAYEIARRKILNDLGKSQDRPDF